MLSVIMLDLTFKEVLSSVPTDPGAILAYVLIAAFVWVIWKGNQPSKPTDAPPAEGDGASSATTTTPEDAAPRKGTT